MFVDVTPLRAPRAAAMLLFCYYFSMLFAFADYAPYADMFIYMFTALFSVTMPCHADDTLMPRHAAIRYTSRYIQRHPTRHCAFAICLLLMLP